MNRDETTRQLEAAERLNQPEGQDRFASKSLQFAYDRYIAADLVRAASFEEELANRVPPRFVRKYTLRVSERFSLL
jgi:hypothetical protein